MLRLFWGGESNGLVRRVLPSLRRFLPAASWLIATYLELQDACTASIVTAYLLKCNHPAGWTPHYELNIPGNFTRTSPIMSTIHPATSALSYWPPIHLRAAFCILGAR